MIERTLAKRYAAALLQVTDKEGTTEKTEALLLALKDATQSLKPFRDMLASPKVPRKVKKQLLRKVFEGRSKPAFLEFLDLLVDKNRLAIIPDLSDMFDRLADASHGIVRVKVKSWRPLSQSHRGSLQKKLAGMTGKKVEIDAEADPSLKGGMLIRIGDSVIDGSVARRLKALGERFAELERR